MSMDDEELRELQDPASWDWEHGEMQPPVKNRRTVLSVAFQGDEFEQVAKAAQRAGKRTSTYVRELALQAANPLPTIINGTLASISSSAPVSWTFRDAKGNCYQGETR